MTLSRYSAPDDVWTSYIASHPKAKQFRNKGLANYEALSGLFGSSIATGKYAEVDGPSSDDDSQLPSSSSSSSSSDASDADASDADASDADPDDPDDADADADADCGSDLDPDKRKRKGSGSSDDENEGAREVLPLDLCYVCGKPGSLHFCALCGRHNHVAPCAFAGSGLTLDGEDGSGQRVNCPMTSDKKRCCTPGTSKEKSNNKDNKDNTAKARASNKKKSKKDKKEKKEPKTAPRGVAPRKRPTAASAMGELLCVVRDFAQARGSSTPASATSSLTSLSQPASSQGQCLVDRFKKLQYWAECTSTERVALLRYLAGNKDDRDLFLAFDDLEATEMIQGLKEMIQGLNVEY
jgi:hypothetical protein